MLRSDSSGREASSDLGGFEQVRKPDPSQQVRTSAIGEPHPPRQ
jgi:hypothetical protein